jgi:hypothetical protein
MPTLHDGREVASDSEDWLWETLARHVLALRTLPERRGFLIGWQDKHGERSANRLRELMTEIHERKAVSA